MPSIFDLDQEYDRILSLIVDGQGAEEIESEFDKLIADAAGLTEQIQNKLKNICALKADIEARSKALAERYKDLQARSKALDNKAKRIKELLQVYMQGKGLGRIEVDDFIITLCGNGGEVPVAGPAIADVWSPEEQASNLKGVTEMIEQVIGAPVKLSVEWDIPRIREALSREGDSAAGAWDNRHGFKLKERGTHVRIS